MRGLVAVVLAAGCVLPRPDAEPAPAPPRADAAVQLAWDALDGHGAAPVEGVLWVAPDCPGGIEYDGECVGGLTFSCDEMYVSVRPGQTPGRSALVHELVHCLVLSRYNDMDAGHERAEWSLVVPVKLLLIEQETRQ